MAKQNNLKTKEDFAKLVLADGLELDAQSISFNPEDLANPSKRDIQIAKANVELHKTRSRLLGELNAATVISHKAFDSLVAATRKMDVLLKNRRFQNPTEESVEKSRIYGEMPEFVAYSKASEFLKVAQAAWHIADDACRAAGI